MNFFIRKKSTLPILKMQLVRDDKLDYHKFEEMLETCLSIEFSMVNRDTGVYKISKGRTSIVKSNDGTQYYVVYKFTEKDTNEEGVYYGEFKIVINGVCPDNQLNIGSLKMPIREELFIHVLNSYIN